LKYLILLGDGMADWPLEALGGRTPLEVARTPSMDRVAALGVTGMFCPIPEGFAPGSDIGNLSLFGYDPRTCFSGRAPLEAARQGIVLGAGEVAFRCNLVTLSDGRMADFTSGHIETAEAAEIITSIGAILGEEFPATFYPGVSYRHLTVLRGTAADSAEALAAAECTPPHDISGQCWEEHLPEGTAGPTIRAMMRRSQALLAEHPVNRRRVAAGKAPATSIWLWGQGLAPSMEPYATKFGLTGAVISAVDLVKGIGVCAGLEVIDVPGATGWVDTDYEAKIAAGLDALGRHDFVYVHVEAPDEAAHQGRVDLKIQAIEDFDRRVVAPALAYLEAGHTPMRLLAAPDHVTAIPTKTHAGGPVPFALCGMGVPVGRVASYNEKAAATSGVLIEDGYRLVQRMIQEDPLSIVL
jgi:2,3-bisphosphoglycerate-independent phosphoglycerate mutase